MPRTQKSKNIYKDIEIGLIDPPNDVTRLEIPQDKIRELAQSIKERTMLEPIVVVPHDSRYEIIAGHRRYLANQYLKNKVISCKIVNFAPQDVALARAIENIQRSDLSPIEEAKIYTSLMENFNLSYDKVGEMTGVSGGVVKRRVKLLSMSPSLIDAVHKELISQSVAEELGRCPDDAHREYLVVMAVEHGVTKEVARSWVDDYLKGLRSGAPTGGDGRPDPGVYIDRPVYVTCELCGAPVDVRYARNYTVCPDCSKQLQTLLEQSSS